MISSPLAEAWCLSLCHKLNQFENFYLACWLKTDPTAVTRRASFRDCSRTAALEVNRQASSSSLNGVLASSVASRCRNRDVPWAPTSRPLLGSASRTRNQIPVLMMDLRKRTTPGRLGIFRGYHYRTDSRLFQVYWRASMVRFTRPSLPIKPCCAVGT